MRRRAFGLAVGLLVVAGCSRAMPVPPLDLAPPPMVPVTSAPTSVPAPDAGTLALAQIRIPVPPVVTGLPGPSTCHGSGRLPDPVCTPGSVNPDVTQATIGSTICGVSGWTATVRPLTHLTFPPKTVSMKAYGIVASARNITEYDHLVPLELGGSDDTSNLWAELSDLPGHGFNNSKDFVENDLNKAVCTHKVTLDAARNAIAANWITAEHVLGLK